jgi:preprotein translocase subunit Sec63
MEGLELLAVVVFFLIGYWVVDFFWPKKRSDGVPPAPAATGPTAFNDNAPWHEVLSVAPDATLEQIRKAYEEKSAQYHPDRVAAMGPEFRETAVRLTRRINDAYEQAIRARP